MFKSKLSPLLLLAWFGTALAAVDINTATEAQLQALKGIGPSTSRAIVDERNAHGPYKSADDLSSRVKGLGPKSLTKLEAQGLTLPGSAAADSARHDGKSGKSGKSAKSGKK
jgi:competence ComEA-like helix-hairpin-helix protein